LLPSEKLGWHHIAGAVFGFLGAGLIVTKGTSISINPDYAFGYAMALVCAVIWSGYSVISRFFASVPTDVVTGFCIATAVLSLLCHLGFETTVWPDGLGQWLAVLGLGIGPLGIAFFTWDYGLKNGDIQVLGAASYAAPVLSTLVLVVTGFASPSWVIAVACALVTGGAVLAAKTMILGR
jgi:drug/metabolite transporter (DMT)-like permease